MFTAEKTRTENKLLTYSFPQATKEDSFPQATKRIQFSPSYQRTQFSPSYERRQLSLSYRSRQLSLNYEREQLETATKRVETKTHTKNDTHSKKTTADSGRYAEGNVNREERRSPDKSHGTMGRQRSKPRTRAEENRPGRNFYNRTA